MDAEKTCINMPKLLITTNNQKI